MTTQEHTADDHSETIGPKARKRLWKVFWLLLAITLFEVGISFTAIPKEVLKILFIGLTIVKAYYIVFFFMHMKHEKVHFAWSILLPFILIVYFIYMMMTEGNALNYIRTVFENHI